MENANHKELFDNAKQAQNNIVEEARLRYNKGHGLNDEQFTAWYNEEFEADSKALFEGTVVASHDLSKGQRRLVDRAIDKLEAMIVAGWVVRT